MALSWTLFVSPLLVSAYDDKTTHPALTQEIVRLFNFKYSDLVIDSRDIELIVRGSVEEDSEMRWMHHFYDPVYGRGLLFGVRWQPSKDWAQDTLAQAKYDVTYQSKSLGGIFAPLFGASTDYSWNRAIYEYVWGDKRKALLSLGHILHLIEDASVPDHTRDDAHPPVLDLGSPYEGWTKKFTRENIKIAAGQIVTLTSLDQYFDSLAKYSNNNFFSKDTICQNKYNHPNVDFERKEVLSDGKVYLFGYKNLSSSQFRLVAKSASSEWFEEKSNKKCPYFLDDNDNLILSDYWDHLSKQAILHGTGVIKLFFDEVEKEKKSKILYEKNRSWLAKKVDEFKDGTFAIASALYGISVTKEDLAGEESIEEPIPPTDAKARSG